MLNTTKIIKTKSFTLATYQKGNPESEKLAILLPGRLDTKDYSHMRSHVDFLASKEYFALSFDPPGTWESPGDLSLYTTTNYLKAIKEIIEKYDNKKTLLVGHSRGGGMATISGVKLEQVEKFVSIMGKTSYKNKNYPDWEQNGFRIHTRDTPNEYKERTKQFNLSYEFVLDAAQYDATRALKKCTKPKLFITGSKDQTVQPSIVKKAYEISLEPKKLVLLDSGHDYRHYPKLIEQVNNIIGEFLKE